MNITPNTIYWITRLDGICAALVIIGALCLGIGFGILGYGLENRCPRCFMIGIVLCIITPVLWIANIFVPTTKEMAAIYIIPSVVNNEKVQKFAENSLDGLVNLSNEWVKEKLTDGN